MAIFRDAPLASVRLSERVVKYTDRFLGSGGRALVHEGQYNGQPAAIKVSLDAGGNPFVHEWGVLNRLLRTGAPAPFEVGEGFLAMEMINGIHPFMTTGRPIGEHAAHILSTIKKISEAVAIIYTQGWVHRDLKPKNIFLTGEGTARIIDFESAVEKGTLTGVWDGTMHYAAPETFTPGIIQITPVMDTYSLGAILARGIRGVEYFSIMFGSNLETFEPILRKKGKLERSGLPGMKDGNIRRLLERALGNPAGRPTDGEAFRAELERITEADIHKAMIRIG